MYPSCNVRRWYRTRVGDTYLAHDARATRSINTINIVNARSHLFKTVDIRLHASLFSSPFLGFKGEQRPSTGTWYVRTTRTIVGC